MRGLPEQFGRNWAQAQGTWNILKNILRSLLTDFIPVEALPTTRLEKGRFVIFKAATGVYWLLLYTGEETYPWAKIGGSALIVQDDDARTLTNVTTFEDLPTDPMSLTLPLDGDYDISIAGSINHSSQGTLRVGRISYAIGSTEAGTNWSVTLIWEGVGNGRIGAYGANETRWFNRKNGEKVSEKAKTDGNYAVEFSRRRLRINPVRVG